MPNRLANELSPYLRQHAGNPVDWYPWGAEALGRARAEDRPVLLSVGYSSCHWCHVMERESFEDDAVAALMNEHFVNVKVDREERPDVDQIYMRAVQAMTGRGGWPMTVFLTPEGVPFLGGTYFPPEPRHGMPSFVQVIGAVAEAWNERREQVESGGAKLLDALRAAATAGTPASVGADDLDRTYHSLASRYDPRHGGFGQAPKFPQPVTLELVLRQHLRTGDPRPLEMCVHTLRRMAAGGMKDHLAGGFHRYSVDARWLVPHFEKMLYDNALLARLYLDAYRVTGEDDLREIAEETLDYLLADMRAPSGGFYAARDADSEGVEGRFYVWSPDQVRTVLDAETAELFCAVYDVTATGNFEGNSILHLPREFSRAAEEHGIAEADLRSRMSDARAALLASRSQRQEPFRDEKIIVAWNGFTIRALAEAGSALGRPDYVAAAEDAATFLWRELRTEGRLLHSWLGGPSDIGAFLDDHAALGNALLSLHGATLNTGWLDAARWLADAIVERFWDDASRTIYDTPADGEALIVRPRDASDTATPSGPSLAAELFARLARVSGEERLERLTGAIIEREAESIRSFGSAFGRMLSVVDRLEAEPVEIAIVGSNDEATRSLVRAAHARTLRNAVVVGTRDEARPPDSPLLADRGRAGGRATAWVCRNFACGLPASTPGEVADRIASLGAF